MFNDKRHGDIWWMSDTHQRPVDTRLIRGDRPVVVVSSDSANQSSSLVTVIPLSASPASLARGDGHCDNVSLLGYGEPDMTLTRQIRTIDQSDLQHYIGHLVDADMNRIDAALRRALGL